MHILGSGRHCQILHSRDWRFCRFRSLNATFPRKSGRPCGKGTLVAPPILRTTRWLDVSSLPRPGGIITTVSIEYDIVFDASGRAQEPILMSTVPMQFSTISPRKWKCQGDGDMVLPRSLRSHLLSHPDTLDFSDYSNISTYQIISFSLTMPIPHIFRRSPRIAVPPSPKLTASPTTPSPKTRGTSTPTTYPIPTHRELSQTEIEMIQFQLLFPQFEIIPYDKLF